MMPNTENVILSQLATLDKGGKKMKITYQLEGRCIWHSDCVEGKGSGIMVSIEREDDRDLMQCKHCGKRGYYPVGSIGEIIVDEVK